jgi:hypothetical protein
MLQQQRGGRCPWRVAEMATVGCSLRAVTPRNNRFVSRSNASQGEMRTAASFLIQSEGVDILASNVAEQQRRVCGVQPHIPSKPSSVVPVL